MLKFNYEVTFKDKIKKVIGPCDIIGLDISNIYYIPDENIHLMAKSMRKITSLKMIVSKYMVGGLFTVVEAFKNLKLLELQFSHCCNETLDFALKLIAKNSPALELISLSETDSISDQGIKALSKGCMFLREINIIICGLITDGIFFHFKQNNPLLERVAIRFCPNVGLNGLKYLEDITTLKELCYNGENVSNERFGHLQEV